MKNLLLILFNLVLFFNVLGADKTTVQNGNWNDPATWGGTVPTNSDNIIIKHTITGGWLWRSESTFTIEDGGSLEVDGIGFNDNTVLEIEEGGSLTINSDFDLNNSPTNTINGNLIINGTFTTSESFVVGATGYVYANSITHGNSDPTLTVYGTVESAGNFNSSGGSRWVYIEDGGEIIVHGDMVNAGGSEFVLNGGSLEIDGSLTNSWGSETGFSISGDASVSIGTDFNNDGGNVTIDGIVNVEGDVIQNDWGGGMDGDGILVVEGDITDNYDRIDDNLLIERMYAIATGNWNTTTIWSKTRGGATCNCLPGTKDRAYITDGHAVTVDINTSAYSFSLSDGSTLLVSAGATLETTKINSIDGDFILEEGAYYIDKGGSRYSSNANARTTLTLSGGKFHYVSPVLSNMNAATFPNTGASFNFAYDESQADHWGKDAESDGDDTNDEIGWYAASGTMSPGQGYAVFALGDKTYTLSGEFNSGSESANITFTNSHGIDDNYNGWNLIGNPYPSGLDIDAFLSENGTVGGNPNITGNIYLWDDDSSEGSDYTTGDYIQYNYGGSISGGNGSTIQNKTLAPHQAFFVQAEPTTSGSVTFTNDMRSSAASVYVKKSQEEEKIERLKFSISSSENPLYNETLVAFKAGASLGYDHGYDGIKRKGNPQIALYSFMGSAQMGIQTVPNNLTESTIPVGFDVEFAGQYRIGVNTNTLEGKVVFLVDRYANTKTRLSTSDTYNFTTERGSFKDRFELFVTSEEMASEETVSIFSADKKVNILNRSDEIIEGEILIFAPTGQLLTREKITLLANEAYTPYPLLDGIYMIQIRENGVIHASEAVFIP